MLLIVGAAKTTWQPGPVVYHNHFTLHSDGVFSSLFVNQQC